MKPSPTDGKHERDIIGWCSAYEDRRVIRRRMMDGELKQVWSSTIQRVRKRVRWWRGRGGEAEDGNGRRGGWMPRRPPAWNIPRAGGSWNDGWGMAGNDSSWGEARGTTGSGRRKVHGYLLFRPPKNSTRSLHLSSPIIKKSQYFFENFMNFNIYLNWYYDIYFLINTSTFTCIS